MNGFLAVLEEQTHAGTWVVQWSTKRVWWSSGTFRIHGMTPQETTPSLVDSLGFFSEDSRSLLQEAIKSAVEDGQDYGLRLKLNRADGTQIDVFAAGQAIFDGPEVRALSGMLFNLSALEQDRLRQKTTAARFEAIIRIAPYGLVVTDSQDKIILVNPAFCDMLGYCAPELVGIGLLELMPVSDREKAQEKREKLCTEPIPSSSFVKRYQHKNGTFVWVEVAFSLLRDEKGTPINFIRQCQNISERKKQEEELFEAKELAQVTLSSIADGVIRTNLSGEITFCNEAAAKILKVNPESILGRSFEDSIILTDAAGQPLPMDPIAYTLGTGLTSRIPNFTRLRSSTGELRPISDSVSPLRNRRGETIGAVFVFQDATESLSFTERLRYEASHDYLTGLPNRATLEHTLAKLLSSLSAEENDSYLFFLDLDHFKTVNDTSGHVAGDLLVQQLSRLLRGLLNSNELFARFGGDEFVLILPSCDLIGAQLTANKILRAVAHHEFVFGDRTFHMSISIGITRLQGPSSNLSRMLAQADAACYVAKAEGRGKYHIYSKQDCQVSIAYDDLAWSNKIRSAIDADLFELFFQGIVDKQRRIVGSEALLRMRDMNGGYVSPALFIPSAERMGLMPTIDRWVFEHALRTITNAESDQRLNAEIGSYLSVNLGARTLETKEFSEWLPDFLASYPNACKRLRIEITETEKARWTHQEVQLVKAIRRHGVKVILDDFGMGYNSFELLKFIELDGIKLDRQVVKDIVTDPVDRALTIASVAIAKSMDMQLVAEGIETEEILDELQALGVEYFQGFLFHIPTALAELYIQSDFVSF